ncbi:MAG: lytic transglycosylase domain-containing protein [Burkholderiales bacterium]|nr:lytic transglycosylase domain-containing protein [Burkholderiales bacterium]
MTEGQKFRPTHGISGASRPDPAQFDGFIREASQKWNVDESLIRAVIKQESGFDPRATSWCGAQGLMQLMPETAAGLGVKDSYDPQQNIMGGTRYLRSLLDRFDGNISKALAGYNAGPGAVEKHGGIPPYQETQHYVANVLEFYRVFKENRGAI